MRVVRNRNECELSAPGADVDSVGVQAHCGAAIAMVTVLTLFTPAFGDTAALASFPSSPRLDTFRTDDLLNPSWTTPALGENGMYLDGTAHEFTGSVTPANTWAAALWNNSPTHEAFSSTRHGRQSAALVAETHSCTPMSPAGRLERRTRGVVTSHSSRTPICRRRQPRCRSTGSTR